MKARIIKIGNSQGLRIPKAILEETGLVGEVELEVKDRSLLIKSIEAPRKGWSESFKAMSAAQDDKLLDENLLSSSAWDDEEWEWR